jgi:hypothetical protein
MGFEKQFFKINEAKAEKLKDPEYIRDNRRPAPHETVLSGCPKDGSVNGLPVYNVEQGKSSYKCYIDPLHKGAGAHIEVFEKGKHIGEMHPTTGKIDTNKADKRKII